MTLYVEDFISIIERIESDIKQSDEYVAQLEKIEPVLGHFLQENKISTIQYFQNQFVLDTLIGEELREWMDWYLYERFLINHGPLEIESDDGKKFTITDLASFADFAHRGLNLPHRKQ